MSIEIVTAPDGSRKVVMAEADYLDLIDARDHAAALREVAAGAPTFSEDELSDYLAARTPLAFFRQRAGMTQRALAEKVGISQAFLAQVEEGVREGGARTWAELAQALGVHIEDLIDEEDRRADNGAD